MSKRQIGESGHLNSSVDISVKALLGYDIDHSSDLQNSLKKLRPEAFAKWQWKLQTDGSAVDKWDEVAELFMPNVEGDNTNWGWRNTESHCSDEESSQSLRKDVQLRDVYDDRSQQELQSNDGINERKCDDVLGFSFGSNEIKVNDKTENTTVDVWDIAYTGDSAMEISYENETGRHYNKSYASDSEDGNKQFINIKNEPLVKREACGKSSLNSIQLFELCTSSILVAPIVSCMNYSRPLMTVPKVQQLLRGVLRPPPSQSLLR